MFGQKLWAAVVVLPLYWWERRIHRGRFRALHRQGNQSRTLMAAAVNHMQQEIPPPGDLILTDYESALMLVYYLCGPKLILPVGTFNLPASRVSCNGHTIASFQTWSMEDSFFLSHFGAIAKAQHLKSGDKVWFFQSGWGVTFGRQLPLTPTAISLCLNPKPLEPTFPSSHLRLAQIYHRSRLAEDLPRIFRISSENSCESRIMPAKSPAGGRFFDAAVTSQSYLQ